MKDVAIIILNYKSWKETIQEADLCNKLLKVDYQDVIIVDNDSPNDSYEMLNKENIKRKYVLIKSEENKGYASGNNIGMRYAFNEGYKYALILNNDIIIEDQNLIKKLITTFRKDSSLAVVNPDIYDPNGYLFNRDAQKPDFFDYTFGLLKYKKKGRKIENKDEYGYVYRPQGCCMMVDLEKMNEINYMDEHTFLYVEEPILAERLLAKNYKCACCLNASIIHNHSKTVKSVFAKRTIIKMNNKSFSYYLRKYRHFKSLQIRICCLFNYIKMMFVG